MRFSIESAARPVCFLYLACRRLWKLLAKKYPARAFVVGQMCATIGDNSITSRLRAIFQNDRCRNLFSPYSIWQTNNCSLFNGGMAIEQFLSDRSQLDRAG